MRVKEDASWIKLTKSALARSFFDRWNVLAAMAHLLPAMEAAFNACQMGYGLAPLVRDVFQSVPEDILKCDARLVDDR